MDLAVLREDMVDSLEHEAKAVVHSEQVGLALRSVPRHEFVPDDEDAYADVAHRVHDTRVLSPSTVGRLIEALDPGADDEILVVGAGVGYTAAVLADIVGARRVHAVDITRRLVVEARRNLARAGYEAVLVDCRDGADGLPEYAPFDRILLEAAAVEPPRRVLDQLAPGGRLVFPHGAGEQTLTSVDADGTEQHHGPVSFVPLLVEGEQAGAIERNRTTREDRERAQREATRSKGWEREWIDWENEPAPGRGP
jgi:protein-L-isoaspartate(D-aspartate) O-methyltransferase